METPEARKPDRWTEHILEAIAELEKVLTQKEIVKLKDKVRCVSRIELDPDHESKYTGLYVCPKCMDLRSASYCRIE